MIETLSQTVSRYLILTSKLLISLLVGVLEWLVPRKLYAKDVSGDIVLITGGGAGLGRDIALEFAKLGSSLVLWDIDSKGLKETQSLVESEYDKLADASRICLIYVVDVSDRVEVKKSSEKVHQDLNSGRQVDQTELYVSILVNNAGIYYGLLLRELRDEQIEKIFKINILAHFWTVRAFLPYMIKYRKGHIVEIASIAGIAGLFKQVDYCATKFATIGFEESLSLELDYLGLADKIHTSAICPFFFKSNLFTGYKATSLTPLMSSKYVAQETVMAVRCNHARSMVPGLLCYPYYVVKSLIPRKGAILVAQMLNLADGIKDIKGTK